MNNSRSHIIKQLEARGFHFHGAMDMASEENLQMAMDAVPTITTTANAGIPSYLNTYVDPNLVRVVFAPNRAATILGDEVKKGDWTTPTAVFPQIESTGEVSSYGDYNQNGMAGVNLTFPQRQNYLYQTIMSVGDHEADVVDLAHVNLINEKRISAAVVLDKFQNTSYFFGVANLQNYGLLNDPNLSAATTPASGAWSQAIVSGTVIYNDVLSLFSTLQAQTGGLITMEDDLVLALPPTVQPALLKVATVGAGTGAGATGVSTTVKDLLKSAFPKLRIESAVQYISTGSGNLVQLIATSLDGQRTATCAYSDKMRTHRMVMQVSSIQQKISQGTYGTVIFRPTAIATMIGV